MEATYEKKADERLDTGNIGRNPVRLNFCIVGAMKSGTTTLYRLMKQHPGLAFSQVKEPGFFSRDERFARGVQYYESLFPPTSPNQLVGEASTCYSRSAKFPNAARRMHAYAPDVKLLFIMRHPVERAFSHYVHEMEIRYLQGLPIVALDEFLWSDPEVLSAGRYVDEINHLRGSFSESQILLLRFDELVAHPSDLLATVWSFLDVASTLIASTRQQHTNARGQSVALSSADRRIASVRKLPLLGSAIALLPAMARQQLRTNVRRFLAHSALGHLDKEWFLGSLEAPSDETRSRLLEYYEPQTMQLERMTGWNLADWCE